MPAIRSVTAGHYRIPLPVVLSDSTHGTITHFDIVTARVTDVDGMEGVGYTYTTGHNGRAIRASLEELGEAASGEDAELTERLWHRGWWLLHYGGRGGAAVLALSALDIALWDLKARRARLPLWRLLGGHDPAVPCYAGGIDLDFSVKQLLEQADGFLASGFHAIKTKVGRAKLKEDVERIEAMRRHLGPDVPLMVDANMKWTADEAIRRARALREFDLVWLEEPTIPDDVAGHVRIAREGGIPVATGENMRTVWEFQQMITAGGVSFPEPDVTNCGGITPFMKIGHLAECFNLPVTSHGAHDITVHLLAALPNRSYLETHGFGINPYIAEPMRIVGGNAIAPDRPGHGVTFDWRGLERLKA